MFEYDTDFTAHAPFPGWESLWGFGPQSVPVSEQESVPESEDLNVNSNWEFPPLGPTQQRSDSSSWRRDVKSYSEVVQPRPQSELQEMEKSLTADGLDDTQMKMLADSESEEIARAMGENPPEVELYTCEQCHGEVQHTDDCPTRNPPQNPEPALQRLLDKCYGEFLCTNCRRHWTSMGSVANRAQHCINCQVMSFPHMQISLRLAAHLSQANTAPRPIGHERGRRTRSG